MPIDAALLALFACVLVAGVAKGVSGFGTGMIVAPVAGALYGPKAALVIVVIIDSLPAIPVAVPAMRVARWREVLPVFAGLFCFVPAGVYILKHGNADVLRWLICLTILALVAVLWSGWRYHGPRGAGVSFAAGSVAGVLSGIASIPGPPVIVYWMASAMKAAVVRANLLTLFLLGEFVSIGNIWLAGLMQRDVVLTGIAAAPVYLAGILVGWWLFGFTSEAAYRRLTYVLIICAALLALPLLDGPMRALAGFAAG